jgi:hypothetical protein
LEDFFNIFWRFGNIIFLYRTLGHQIFILFIEPFPIRINIGIFILFSFGFFITGFSRSILWPGFSVTAHQIAFLSTNFSATLKGNYPHHNLDVCWKTCEINFVWLEKFCCRLASNKLWQIFSLKLVNLEWKTLKNLIEIPFEAILIPQHFEMCQQFPLPL